MQMASVQSTYTLIMFAPAVSVTVFAESDTVGPKTMSKYRTRLIGTIETQSGINLKLSRSTGSIDLNISTFAGIGPRVGANVVIPLNSSAKCTIILQIPER